MFGNIFLNWNFLNKSMLESIISFSLLYWTSYSYYYLFSDFYKFFKCCLFNKNFSKSTENVCEQLNISKTNNWIRLLILVNFYFLNLNLHDRNNLKNWQGSTRTQTEIYVELKFPFFYSTEVWSIPITEI